MIKPLNNYVLLKKEVVENKTASGIIISVNEKDEDNIATVIAVSDGKLVDNKLVKLNVEVGQKVIYDKYSSHEVDYQNEKFVLIEDDKIYAIID